MKVQNIWNTAKKVFLTLGLVGIILTNSLFSLPAEANSDSWTEATVQQHAGDSVSSAIQGCSHFSTLAAALEAADLVDALEFDGPFTVFAPTNKAFAALPPGLVEDLLLPENLGELIDILTYHVVPGEVMSYDLESGSVFTLAGDDIDVLVSDSGVQVDGANVILPDTVVTNGVIHVIDSVILPFS